MSKTVRTSDMCPLCYGSVPFNTVLEAAVAHRYLPQGREHGKVHVVKDRRGQIVSRKR